MAKTCSTCIFAERETGIFGNWYCSYITTRIFGQDHCTRVSPNDSCDHYSPISTPENSGFTGKGSGGCFLTSACVEYLGKPDDCEELTILRNFRDCYLKGQENGDKLIEEYYKIAPIIVQKINISEKKVFYYDYIYQNIQKCIAFIKQENFISALETYSSMVNYLKVATNV